MKGVASRMITVYCSQCTGYLFRYLKQGNGSFSICLVEKMFESRASQPQCPGCSSDLGRVAFINNNLAWKLLPTKVFWKRGRQPKHTPPPPLHQLHQQQQQPPQRLNQQRALPPLQQQPTNKNRKKSKKKQKIQIKIRNIQKSKK